MLVFLFFITTFLPHPNVLTIKTCSNVTKIKAATIHCKNRPDIATWKQFQDAGVTHIVLVPKATMYKFDRTGKLNDVASSSYWSESVRGINEAVITSKKYGMQVIVKLHLYPSESVNMKGGLEKIKYTTELGKEYSPIVLRYAKLCNELNVPIFVMCNETTEFYSNTDYWTKLIAEVRKAYHGKLTIGATATCVDQVNFWDKLDYIGVSGYYVVANRKNPTELEMKAGWIWHKRDLMDISAKYNKPILFTEFGCNASESCAMRPWEWQKNLKGSSLNYPLQASYYSTMLNAFWNEPWFAGICVWQTYSLSEIGNQGSTLGTPQGHEAWNVIKQYRVPD